MMDTSPQMQRQYQSMLMQCSGEKRLKMGCSMHATAKTLVRASIVTKDPTVSPSNIRRALFLRFYGNDFNPETQKKIIRALENSNL